jgi:hypothetical protein
MAVVQAVRVFGVIIVVGVGVGRALRVRGRWLHKLRKLDTLIGLRKLELWKMKM